MTFKLEINCDNVAFDDDHSLEVSAILLNIEKRIIDGETSGVVIDTNGNRVGSFTFQGKRKE